MQVIKAPNYLMTYAKGTGGSYGLVLWFLLRKMKQGYRPTTNEQIQRNVFGVKNPKRGSQEDKWICTAVSRMKKELPEIHYYVYSWRDRGTTIYLLIPLNGGKFQEEIRHEARRRTIQTARRDVTTRLLVAGTKPGTVKSIHFGHDDIKAIVVMGEAKRRLLESVEETQEKTLSAGRDLPRLPGSTNGKK